MADFVPEGFVPLLEAVERVAEAFFQDEWSAASEVLPEDDIWIRDYERRVAFETPDPLRDAIAGRSSPPLVTTTKEDAARAQAIIEKQNRRQNVRNKAVLKLRQALASGTLPATLLERRWGKLLRLEPSIWNTRAGVKAFNPQFGGQIVHRKRFEGPTGRVLIGKKDLTSFVTGKPAVEPGARLPSSASSTSRSLPHAAPRRRERKWTAQRLAVRAFMKARYPNFRKPDGLSWEAMSKHYAEWVPTHPDAQQENWPKTISDRGLANAISWLREHVSEFPEED